MPICDEYDRRTSWFNERVFCPWAEAITPPSTPFSLFITYDADPSSRGRMNAAVVAASLLVGLCLFVVNAYREPRRRCTHFLAAWPQGFVSVAFVGFWTWALHFALILLPYLVAIGGALIIICIFAQGFVLWEHHGRPRVASCAVSASQKFLAWVHAVDEAVAPAKPKEEEKKEEGKIPLLAPENEL